MKNFTLIFTIFLIKQLFSQGSYHTIGNSNIVNSVNTYPSIYGNAFRGVKNQFLIRADEMQSAGMSAGNITSLSFDVVSPPEYTIKDFEIEIKSTTQNSITSWDNSNLTSCFGPSDINITNGWNQHNFSTPFYWDGISNLVIKTCFYNDNGANNAIMKMSNYSYNALIYRRSNGNPCPATWINGIESLKPNIKIQWLNPNSPPISDFDVSSLSTCSGTITFTDLSTDNTTSWLWNFGDGNTSTEQNPSHTYINSGNYNVQLISTNSFGSDTSFTQSTIEVNLSGSQPLQPNCIPETQYPGSLNCGITEFNIGDFSKSSLNSIEGYSDFTCGNINLFVGEIYDFYVTHEGNALQNFSMWLDVNNNGIFDLPNEEIYTNIGANFSASSIQIPTNAVLDTPLRLRIMADNTFQGGLIPCTNPVNGQAEDYSVVITINTNPPSSNFTSDKNYTCDGIINFTDISTNVPYSWFWQFGDGNTSMSQNPTHNYAENGSYNVTLITSNNYGSDTITKNQFIYVDNNFDVIPTSCNPSTLNHFDDYGIEKVEFANIYNLSQDGEEGYMDFSCEQRAYVDAGGIYILKVTTGSENPHDTRAWIDFNNDGNFDTSELVMEKLNTFEPSDTIQIPYDVIYDTSFRMRISSDLVGSNNGPCDDVIAGQVEDYGIFSSLCPNPNNVTIGEITNNSVEFFWDYEESEISWNIQYGETGYNPLDQTGSFINNIFVHNYHVIGLDEAKDYDFYFQSNCSSGSSIWIGPYSAMTTGVNSMSNSINIQIIPNPNNGIFEIKSSTTIKNIEVYNLFGKKINYYDSRYLNSLVLNLENNPKGIYFLKIFFNDRVLTKKTSYN